MRQNIKLIFRCFPRTVIANSDVECSLTYIKYIEHLKGAAMESHNQANSFRP